MTDDQANTIQTGDNFKGSLAINGVGNNILIMPGKSICCGIEITGNGNSIYIEEDCLIEGGWIGITANDSAVRIGKRTTIAHARIHVSETSSVSIGEDCMLSKEIWMDASDSHSIYDVQNNQRLNPAKEIIVEDHVWIGFRTVILKGCRIGSGAVIGASSVVSKDIPPNSVAAGNPIKVLRENVRWERETREIPAKRPPLYINTKFVLDPPTDLRSIGIYSGAWSYKFETMDREAIVEMLRKDLRPHRCTELFQSFRDFHVLELGPADGYHTAALELLGAAKVTAIEANKDCFIKCLIIKNLLNLRAKFLLGDFTKYFDTYDSDADLLFASGVLYHLIDPVEFLQKAAKHIDRIFLWTHVYDESAISDHPSESVNFSSGETETKVIGGRNIIYHRKYYEENWTDNVSYTGGLCGYCHWMSREDTIAAVKLAGYQTLLEVYDDTMPDGLPIIVIAATK